ncbi:MAG: glycosyltransferase family 2 protein [Pirellulaceae bacterium]
MIFIFYSLGLFVLAALPALMVYRSLPLFERATTETEVPLPSVSVLIPARNEEVGIANCVQAALVAAWPACEVVVMDDHSTDATVDILKQLQSQDARLRIAHAAELPVGWNGKQHACWQLACTAQHEFLLFLDADVRLSPDALKRWVSHFQNGQVDLLSGFPHQECVGISEKLLIPMMYFLLLGYLPLDQMRANPKPEFGAGCGQLFLTRKSAYMQCDGHRAIQASRHDGLKLPRAFRAAGLMSDLFDASDTAKVRMYTTSREVVWGVLKNADEGIANSKLIVLFTVLLLGASVLPVLSLPHAAYYGWPLTAVLLLFFATVLSYMPRAMIARRLKHSVWGVLLHPLAVAIFVALQWIAFVRRSLGFTTQWRGRVS